jgi:hypothetical protein
LNTFPDDPTELNVDFPIAVADIIRDEVQKTTPQFRAQQYEQGLMRWWTVRLMVLEDPKDPNRWTATQRLYAHVDALGAALRKEDGLGGRVEMASPRYATSYDPGEADMPDSTVARVATMTIVVGERVTEV